MLSTAAGSTATVVNLCVVTALYGGLTGNSALAGLGLAAASYMSVHPLLLLVRHRFPTDVSFLVHLHVCLATDLYYNRSCTLAWT